MYRGVVSFALRSSHVDFSCPPNEFEIGGVKVGCEGGRVVFKINVVGDSPEVINELGRRAPELFVYAMSLVQGVGFDADNDADNLVITWRSINAAGVITSMKTTAGIRTQLNEGLLERAINLMNKLGDALQNPGTSKRVEELLRAVRWWVSGSLDEDPLDRFLKFFIAFEMLASLEGYKRKFGDSWVEKFCVDYGLTCEFDGVRANRVRNLIIHEPGEDRDRAEEIARKHADEFGREVLKAIRRALSEELGIGV